MNQKNSEKQIIKDGKIVIDECLFIKHDDYQSADFIAFFNDLLNEINKTDETNKKNSTIIVPLEIWQQYKNQLQQRDFIGVWLTADQEIYALVDNLSCIHLIALEFPHFTDGRHYSTAAILRNSYNYQGEIRAFGDVLRDQLQAMQRVGFNSFVIRADKDINDALQGLNALPV